MGVEINELLGDELDPVVFVLIFGGMSLRGRGGGRRFCGISIPGDGVTQLTDQQSILCLPPENFPLGLKGSIMRTHPRGSFEISGFASSPPRRGTGHPPHHHPRGSFEISGFASSPPRRGTGHPPHHHPPIRLL